jgi:hypothetical protein
VAEIYAEELRGDHCVEIGQIGVSIHKNIVNKHYLNINEPKEIKRKSIEISKKEITNKL